MGYQMIWRLLVLLVLASTACSSDRELLGNADSPSAETTDMQSAARPTPERGVPMIFNALSPRSPAFDPDSATGGVQFLLTTADGPTRLRSGDDLVWTLLSGATFRPGGEPGLLAWTHGRRPQLLDLEVDGSPTKPAEARAVGSINDPDGALFETTGNVLWLTKTSELTNTTKVERIDLRQADESQEFEIRERGRLVYATQEELFIAVDQLTSSSHPDEILYRVSPQIVMTSTVAPLADLATIVTVHRERVVAIVSGGAGLELYDLDGGDRQHIDPPSGFRWRKINNIPTPSFSPSPRVHSDNNEVVIGLEPIGEQGVTEVVLVDLSTGTQVVQDPPSAALRSAYFSWTGELVLVESNPEGFTIVTVDGASFDVPLEIYAFN